MKTTIWERITLVFPSNFSIWKPIEPSMRTVTKIIARIRRVGENNLWT
jgi:hypothetical protein